MKRSAEEPSGSPRVLGTAIFTGIVLILGGAALFLLMGLMDAFGSGTTDRAKLKVGFIEILGVLTLVIGITGVVFGILARVRPRPGVWRFGVGLYTGLVLLSIVAIVLGNEITLVFFVGIIIGALMLFDLFTRDVRRAFEEPNSR